MMKFTFKIALLFFLIPFIGFAHTDPKQEKSKTIQKKYTVDRDATVAIDNKYGNINITTWNENRVEITVKITVKGNSMRAVEKKLDGIDVDFNANSSRVSAKTRFNTSSSNWSFFGNANNTSYKVQYTIKMPVSNQVNLDNDYGNILIDQINGKANINCDYGKLIIGDLNNSDNNINIDYCNGSSINFMKSGVVNADYSKLSIDKTDNVKINSDYTTINIGTANTVTYNTDYGNINVDDVANIRGNSDYASIRLGTVSKGLDLTADYGSIKIKELANGFDKAEISSEYAGITIGTRANNNFDFILNLQYAGFRYNKNNVEIYKSIEKSSKKYYEGTYGKGKSNATLMIKSQYGSVTFKEL